MSNNEPVLVIGGTGMVGSQVVSELRKRGKSVRALARATSNTSRLESAGVEIARGDMMDVDSLVRAMDGVDAVITTAAGYTGHTKGDSSDTDVVGNANLATAADRAGVRRFVLTSILTADQTPQVPHFWHKKLAEDRLEELGVPFVALRPGAFLDQMATMNGDAFAKGRLMWLGSKNVPLTFVLTSHLAGYLAASVDADVRPGERIEIGWEQPVSMRSVADIAEGMLGKKVRVTSIPAGLMRAAGGLVGSFKPVVKDMSAMTDWFETGRYVADTTRQREVFGKVPAAESAVADLLVGMGHSPRRR